MLKTPLCSLLGIEYPVLQGGMAWVSDYHLASAVSEAGGLGIIAAMSSNGQQLRYQIQETRKRTDKPFGVNVMLMSPYVDEVAQVIAEEKVSVVTTGAGNPAKYMKLWLDAGIKVIPVVASVAMAKLAERNGAVAIIAEGTESGGHIGETTTIALLPQVCDAVSIPVIAAGGIADGRGLAAVLMLGAVGVQMGTVFLSSYECNIHQNYKDKIVKAKDIDTIATGKRLGHPVRSLKSPFSRELFRCEYDTAISDEELEKMGVGALRKAAVEGDLKNGCFMAGQICGLVNTQRTAKEIITDICNHCEIVLGGSGKWVR